MAKCNVIGLGYIGLPTSLILANAGHEVIGVDINQEVIENLTQAKTHINEPDLQELLQKYISKGTFKAQTTPSEADIFIIAVPTPLNGSKDPKLIPVANLNYIYDAIDSISTVIKDDNLIILESTSPVGTTENLKKRLLNTVKVKKINIAYCPERVLPGQIIKELISNDRVIGGITKESAEICKSFYSTFCKGQLLITDDKTAEMIKLTENAFRDVNIAFSNELSMICNDLKIDVDTVITYSNRHPRVNILNPGCGAGGHCIPIDPWFIASKSPKFSHLIQTARFVNDNKTSWVIEIIKSRRNSIKELIKKEPTIGIFGLTFKPNVEDLRESPALKIFETLSAEGFNLIACEPNLENLKKVNLFTKDDVINKSDLLVFLVGHSDFSDIDFKKYDYLDFCGISK